VWQYRKYRKRINRERQMTPESKKIVGTGAKARGTPLKY